MKTKTTQTLRKVTHRLAALIAMAVAPAAFAANGTWNNAPVSGEWTNVLNWHGGVVPGTINNTANNGTDSGSIAFFTNAITTFGGTANPVTPDDATVVNGKARMMGRVVFDGPNCGAYVFSSLSPYAAQTGTTPETGVMSLCVPAPVNQNATNGSYITASVTTPQTFLVPVQIRLPSSTTGHYGFTNNATSPNATFYFQRLFLYPGATGRGVNYIFTGSNTGTNTVALLEQSVNQTGSPSSIRKNGTGRWILSGANTFAGASAVNIDEGTLEVLNPAAFGAVGTTASVNSNGVLQINGVTLNVTSLGLRNSGTVRMNGAAGINGVSVNNGVGNTPILATTSASDVFTVGTGLAAASIVAGGAADSVLNTTGPGTLVFGQNGAFANTYVGRWAFGAATNQINGASALGTGANANVNAGAILDLTPMGATAFVPTTSGFGGSGTGTAVGISAATVIADAGGSLDLTGKAINLNYNPASFSGDLTRPALYVAQGGLVLSGNTLFINNTSGTPLGTGTYRLMQSATAITSGGGYAALISGSGMVGGASAAIQVSGGNVDLIISIYVPKNLVWSGTGSSWDLATTADWLNGVTPSVFNNSDNVTFNSVGSANPNVSLTGTLTPSSVIVNTSANDYTLAGSGQIAGTTSLKKISAGVLNLQTVNTYAGGTVVSNGTLRVGANNAISSTGAGDVAVHGSGVIDLNGFNNTVNGLSGNGSIDNQGGGAAILTVGNNNNGGTFSGVLKNASGTLALSKVGNGTLILTSANSYGGGSTVNGGTLILGNSYALGTNGATVNSGTVDIQTDLHLASLAGAGGTVANNSTATTNVIFVEGGTATTYSGNIVNGSGGGGIAVRVLNGSALTLGGNNTYTGGTFVGTNSSLFIPNGPAAVGGVVIASNNATLGLSGGGATPGTPVSVTTVDGATVSFTSGALGKIWGGQFIGGPTSTNRILNVMSFGGDTSFKDFPGVVQLEAAGNARFINIPGGAAGGSDNTTFDFIGATAVVTRDAATVRLGHIVGGSSASGVDGATTAGVIDTYILGGKSIDSTFYGYFRGSNNLVKIGSAKLIFAGANVTTNTDSATYTNYFYASLVAHSLNTTISNGTLGLVVPNNLSNSPVVTLAGSSAVLDVSKIGFVQDQLDEFSTVTNQVLVTNGVMHVYAAQTLGGVGSIQGAVVADSGSTLNPGLTTGTLAISGSATINGAVNMNLNRANSPNSSRITAASFAGSGATLTVTNLGATLVTGDTFQLFSGAVAAFSSVNLPVASADNSITYVWDNKIAVDGTIKVLSGASAVNPNPTNITTSASGNQLTLSWPASHTGWTLQAQTNALNIGLSGTWVNVAGSSTTNQVIMPINPANPTVFYRLNLVIP